MLKVTVNGVSTLLDLVHLDSGEEPESKCTNTVVVARLGDFTFQYAMPIEGAIKALKDDLAYRSSRLHAIKAVAIPKVITVMIVRYHERFTIDWDGARSMHSRSVEMALSDNPDMAQLGRAALEQSGMSAS